MTQPDIVDVTEQKRLNEAREAGVPWKKWGPYVSERQWGTVREDFITDLAFRDESLAAEAKLAILVASLLAAVWGAVVLHVKLPRLSADIAANG